MNDTTPKTLYHYCSHDTFEKIMKSKSIWLTNNKSSNDALENRIIQKHLPWIKKFFIDNQASEIVELINKHYEEGESQNYVFCLSGDNGNRLSQWRGYGQDGKGISIGFNLTNLSNQLKPSPKLSISTILIDKVLYKNNKQHRFLQIKCEEALQEWLIDDNKDRRYWMVSVPFLNFLRRYDATLKDNFFFEEKEFRIVHLSLNQDDHSHHSLLSDLKEIKRDHEYIFKYKSLNFDNGTFEKLIDKVIIGPLNESTEDDVNSFLEKHNLHNITVKKISSSYRQKK